MDLNQILDKAVQYNASDVHMQAGSHILLRIGGQLRSVESAPLEEKQLTEFLLHLAGEERSQLLRSQRSVDFAYQPSDKARFRVSLFFQRGSVRAAFRTLPTTVPSFDSLNLPSAVRSFAEEERGLVLVTGTTSSGKSTTVAALIDYINATRRRTIVTIEDPIEFVHHDKKSMVSQREVGTDTPGFAEALRRVLRQDPNVIFVGELRDYETMATATRAADTGHLVFSTVHTTNATQTLQRISAMFPPEERDLLTMQLASNLLGAISLRLATATGEKTRIPVVEIMRSTPIIRKIILERRFTELSEALASREMGMQLFDQHLVELVKSRRIQNREGLRLASNPEHVAMALAGISSEDLAGGIIGN